jgi:hypothetical protein
VRFSLLVFVYCHTNVVAYLSAQGRAYNPGSGVSDVLFIPYFSKRQFANSFAISVTFRLANTAGQTEYVLVANDNCLRVSVLPLD